MEFENMDKIVSALRVDCSVSVGALCAECPAYEWCHVSGRSLTKEAADLIEKMAAEIDIQRSRIEKIRAHIARYRDELETKQRELERSMR